MINKLTVLALLFFAGSVFPSVVSAAKVDAQGVHGKKAKTAIKAETPNAASPASGADQNPTPKGPAAPNGFKAVSGEIRQITLSWSKRANSAISGFVIQKADMESGPFADVLAIKGGAEISAILKHSPLLQLEDGNAYFFRIVSVNEVGAMGAPSPAIKANTQPKPEIPVGLGASNGKFREVLLTWKPITKEEIKGYEIYRADGGPFVSIGKISGKDKASYSDKGSMLDGKIYQYKIASFNAGDVHSDLSIAMSGITKSFPEKPKGLSATSGEVKLTNLTWKASPEVDIKEYLLWKSPSPDKKSSQAGTSQNSSTVIKGLDDGETLYFRVTAKDANGVESEPSEAVRITTKPLPLPPGAPSATTPTAKSVSISWKASATPDIAKYNVYSEEFLSTSLVGSTDGTTIEITKDIDPDSSYTFFIKAVDVTGLESKSSGSVEVKTPKR